MFKLKANQPYKQWNAQKDPFMATRLKIVAIILVGAIIGLATSWYINQSYVERLQDNAETFVLGVDARDIERLKNTALSDGQVPYEKVKDKLAQLKNVYDKDVEFVYIMDKQGSDVKFLVDSEPKGSESYSPRGQIYEDATLQLQNVFSTGEPLIEGPVSDDYGIWYSAIAPIKDDNGKLVAVLGIDVPAESYLLSIGGIGGSILLLSVIISIIIYFYDRQRNRRLQAFRFQVELMSIASHELRTPLSGIRWGQEVLLQGTLDKTQKTMVDAMYESTLQLQDSIEDILQLASMDTSKPKQAVRIEIDIAELVDGTMKVQQLPAQQKDITYVYDQSWTAPIMTEGDGTQLRRVFNNLLSNAVKYASIGSQITISYKKENAEHIISIKNKGIGVPQKELAHIFDGFYRATNAIEKQVNGTGMGLYLSRVTVEQHGGRLWIESIEGESTTAIVALPASTGILQETVTKHDTSVPGSDNNLR